MVEKPAEFCNIGGEICKVLRIDAELAFCFWLGFWRSVVSVWKAGGVCGSRKMSFAARCGYPYLVFYDMMVKKDTDAADADRRLAIVLVGTKGGMV